MKLRSALLSIFLFCGIDASYSSGLDKEGEENIRAAVKQLDMRIKNPATGTCIRMDTDDSIFVGGCNTQEASWDLTPPNDSSPFFLISLDGTTKCLDGRNELVEVYTCKYKYPRRIKSQMWQRISGERIQNRKTKTCMDINKKTGMLILVECNTFKSQIFDIKPKNIRSNPERIVSAANDKCVKVGPNAIIKTGTCDTGVVTWIFKEDTNQIQFRDFADTNSKSECLDAVNGVGGRAIISTCDDTKKSQQWILDSNTIKSSFVNECCLRANASSKQVSIQYCRNGARFQFEFRNNVAV